jgi:hypothetical protein
VALAGSWRLDLRLEVFNLFNRANFGNPTLIASPAPPPVAPQELRPDQVDGDLARQMQRREVSF